ncbi:MAG TPA: hypothetical protein VFG21_11870 [Xanthomonadaceae bacterium]|nr:hypothetical protein [Xanthomonadaceae bacterium]
MRWIRRTAAVVLSLLLLWLLLALSGWLPPIPEANRQSLQALREPPQWPAPQGNAFHAVWLGSYELDASERARLAALDPDAMIRELAQRTAVQRGSALWPGQCGWPHTGCAAALRESGLQEDPAALEALRALYRYDHFRNLATPSIEIPFPALQGLDQPARVAAVQRFDAGEHSAALGLLCEDAAFWRRLRANTDLLLVDMVGVAYLSADATLFAELLAELSPESDLPPQCERALAPLADQELDQCRVFSGEFALLEQGFDDAALAGELAGADATPVWRRWLVRPLFHREHMLGQIAPAYTAFCGPEHAQRIAERARFPDGAPVPDRCNALEWGFNAVGCVLAEVGSPSWAAYYERVLDLDSRLKLVSTALWLRQQPAGQPLPLLFDTRPLPLREAGAELVVDDGAAALRVRLRHRRGNADHYTIPVAAPQQ